MKTVLIAAMAEKNRTIGIRWILPWHLPEDLANFKRLTSGKPVVMWRKTYESLPDKFRPLPNRRNVVISRGGYQGEGFESASSPENAISKLDAEGKDVAFVIGWAQIYQAFVDSETADEIWLSLVPGDFDWDAFFPQFEDRYVEIERVQFETFTFVRYEKR